MKHLKTLFVFMLTLLLGIGQMWADVGDVYYTFLPYKPSKGAVTDYTKTGTMTIDGKDWTVPGNWYANGALRLGGKSLNQVDRTIIGQDTLGVAIAKIRVAHAGVTSDKMILNSVTVTTASDADFTKDVTTKTVTSFTIGKNTQDTIDIVPTTEPWATGSYYKIAFNLSNSNSSNYAFVVESILFYAYKESGPSVPTVSAVQGETDVVADGLSFTAKQNVAVTPQTFTLTGANLTEGLTLTPSSEAFVVSPISLTKAEAEAGATITVTPATPTEATSPVQGTLTISGEEGLDDTEIALSMTVTQTYAVGVALNVKDKNDNVLTGENIPAGIAATIAGGASYYATSGESNIALAATTIAGWDFEGWTSTAGTIADADAFSTTLTAAAEAATVTASFQEKKCTVLGTPTNVVVSGIAVANYPYESVALAWDAVDNAAGYSVTIKLGENVVESNDVTTNAYSVSTTLTPNTEYTYEIIATNSDAAYCASNVATANFTTGDYPAATLTLSENGVTHNLEGKQNDVVTLPTALTSAIQGKTLVGWSTEVVTSTDTKPSGETFFEPGAEFTLSATSQKVYAVLMSGSEPGEYWSLATSVTAGDVVVFSSKSGYKTHEMKTNGSFSGTNNYMGATLSTYSSDTTKITSLAEGTLQFTLGGNDEDGWTFKTSNNKYLYVLEAKKINVKDEASTWSIEFDGNIATVSQNSAIMYYNYNKEGDNRFNAYAASSSLTPTSLYKRVTTADTRSDYTTQAYAVSFAAPTNGTLAIKKGDAAITSGDFFSAGVTLTIEATPAEGYQLKAINVNGNELSGTTLTVPAEAVTVTAEFEAIPVISGVPTEDISFPNARQHGTIVDQTFTLMGANLTSKLTLSATGGFTVSPEEITPEAGAVNQLITLSHSTEVADDFVGTLTISGGGLAAAATVDLLLTVTPTYAITAASVTGGSFSWEDDQSNANPAYVAAGTLIQAAADNATGYTFEAFDIYKTGEATTKVDHTDGLFEMPAYAVTIGGSFTENKIPEITLSQTEDYLFDDVAKGGSTSMTFTVSAAYLSNNITVAVSGTDAAKFGLSTTSITISEGGVENAEVTITPVTTEVGTFEATITVDDGEEGAAAKSFGVMIEVLETYTAKWYVNGNELTESAQTAVAGTALTFPENPSATDDCVGLVFQGWLTSELEEASATAPEGLITETEGLTMPAAGINYYAVFAEKEGDDVPAGYSMSTSAPANGDKVIITLLYDEKYYAMTSSQTPGTSELTIVDGMVSEPANNIQWDLASADYGLYVYPTGQTTNCLHMNTNALKVASGSTNGDIVFSANDDGSFKAARYNSENPDRWIVGTNSFGCSDTEDDALALYIFKYSAGSSATYSNYVTSCQSCATLPAPTNLKVSNIYHYGADFSWDAVANADGYYLEVALYDDPADQKSMGGLTQEQLSDSVRNLEAGTHYTYFVKAFNNDEVNYCNGGWSEATTGDFWTDPYYITGSFNNWAMTPMTADSFVFENLAAGTYEIKVSIDGTFDDGKVKGFTDLTPDEMVAGLYSGTNDNIVFTLAKAGKVVVTYNQREFKVVGEFEAQSVELAGYCAGNWDWDSHVQAEISDDRKSATAKKTFNKDEWVTFKMVVDSKWMGTSGDEDYKLTRDDNSVSGLFADGKNQYFQADKTGEYEFTWTFGTNAVTVKFPDHSYTVAWSLAAGPDETLGELERQFDPEGDPTDSYTLTMLKDVLQTGTFNVKVFEDDATTPIATTTLNIDEVAKYELSFQFYYFGAESTVEASATKKGIPTGVDETGDGQKAVKVMKDNTIYIIRGDKTYTITGQVVK